MGVMDRFPRAVTRATLTVAIDEAHERLVDLVFDRMAARIADYSRSEARRAIVSGAVRVNGAVRRIPSLRLRPGMHVEVAARAPAENAPCAALRILFDDGVLLAIDKPAGLPTVPTAHRGRASLVSLLEEELRKRCGSGTIRLGVHQRLDASTSGLVLFTTDPRANAGLARQIAEHEVQKRYLAIVSTRGAVVPDSFVIDDPIGESPGAKAGRMSAVPGGRPALTSVRVIERMPRALLVEAEPATDASIRSGFISHPEGSRSSAIQSTPPSPLGPGRRA